MTTTPLVSIVLPVYNGSLYLEQSIQSCIKQSYRKWELIIVDDASTDDTFEIIKKYRSIDTRIRCLRHDKNLKLPKALNTGFSDAKGVYYTWTSDDNAYHPEALKRMVEVIGKKDGVDIIYSDFTAIDIESESSQLVTVKDPEFLACSNVIGGCFLFHKDVYHKLGGYDEEMFLVEDYHFWLRAFMKFRMMPVHEDLYIYRYHGRSLTSTESDEIKRKVKNLLSEFLPKMSNVHPSIKAMGYINNARTSSRFRDVNGTIAALFNAMRCDPSTVINRQSFHLIGQALLGKEGMNTLLRPYRKIKNTYKSTFTA